MCICFSEIKGIVRSFHQKNRKKIRDCNLLGKKRHISIFILFKKMNKELQILKISMVPIFIPLQLKLHLMFDIAYCNKYDLSVVCLYPIL